MKRSIHATRRIVVPLIALTALCSGPPASAGPPATAPQGHHWQTEPISPAADARHIHLPEERIVIALWEQRLTAREFVPAYAVSMDGGRVQRATETSYEISVARQSFDPLTAVPAVSPRLVAAADGRLFIVQFWTQPLEAYRRQLRGLGGVVLHYLPQHAHLVELDATAVQEVAALPFVRWVGPYHPAYRVSPEIREALDGAGDGLPALQRYNIMVVERGPRQKNIVANRIRALGGAVDLLPPSGFSIEATLTPAQLLEIVRMNEVLFVDRWTAPVTCLDIAREIGGANDLENAAGYTGAGVRGEVMELNTGQLNHPGFLHHPPIVHGPADGPDSHATNTYGIIFGDGTGNSAARGMLPDAQGIMAIIPEDRYEHTAELLASPYFASFQSNSWGYLVVPDGYSIPAAEIDDILFLHDLLLLNGIGNFGETTLQEGIAKNPVSVGGVFHQNTLTKADDCWCGTSTTGPSIGPAPDGRIKPDLMHFYDNVLTATTGGGYDPGFGGTSAATPITAGHFGLFFEMWSDGLFGNPVDPGGTVFENRPHAATAKAMMINTASQYPFSGTTHDLTRTHQGWGMADVGRLYELRDRIAVIVDETDLLTNLGSMQYPIVVNPGQEALRATLVYTDPAGVPLSNPNRVNDLTLRALSPSAVVYWGNNGLLAGNWSAPGGGPNSIDTVENIFVQNPEPGMWTIRVSADEINADGHPESPAVDADYALVVGFESAQLSADFDGDGDVDLADFAAFAQCFGGANLPPAGGCPLGVDADLDGDSDVDLADFAIFGQLFTGAS